MWLHCTAPALKIILYLAVKVNQVWKYFQNQNQSPDDSPIHLPSLETSNVSTWLAQEELPNGGPHDLQFPLFLCISCVSSLHHGKSSSTGNLLEREDMALPVPDYGIHSRMAAQSAAALHGRQQRPYSVAVPGFSQVGGLQNKHTNTCKLASTHMGSHMTHEQSHETWQRSRLSQKVWR